VRRPFAVSAMCASGTRCRSEGTATLHKEGGCDAPEHEGSLRVHDRATDGDIGTIKECYFDDLSYTVRYSWSTRGVAGGAEGAPLADCPPKDGLGREAPHSRADEGQVEKSPNIDTDKPSRGSTRPPTMATMATPRTGRGLSLGAYPYPYLGSGPALSAADLAREQRWHWEAKEREDPHLRSAHAVTGYHIQATDGEIGHVEDFFVDDKSWTIRYMLVDTTNWWAGKKVLVAPAWIQRVDWAESKVHVTVTRAQIEKSPEYDPTRPVERPTRRGCTTTIRSPATGVVTALFGFAQNHQQQGEVR